VQFKATQSEDGTLFNPSFNRVPYALVSALPANSHCNWAKLAKITAMNFPLNLRLPFFALTSQIVVTDSANANVCFVRQKFFKLKEAVEVFTDQTRSQKLCEIKANKIIDFSATYNFIDCNGKQFGSVSRQGMRSLLKAHYDIMKDGKAEMSIQEENPWVKLIDGLVGQIPIIGAFTGLFFHPSYLVSRIGTGQPLVRIKKRAAFWESRFTMEQLSEMDNTDELRVVLATIMMVLLEKERG
jgi:hypothetical protein